MPQLKREGQRWEESSYPSTCPVLRGDIREEVGKLRQELDGDIVVHGSRQLADVLIDHDLFDELHLMVFHVLLGAGERVFGDTSHRKTLRLVDSKTVGDGGNPHLQAGQLESLM
jgi:dihydrofolate reductase